MRLLHPDFIGVRNDIFTYLVCVFDFWYFIFDFEGISGINALLPAMEVKKERRKEKEEEKK